MHGEALSVFRPAVVATAVDDLPVNGIVLSRNLWLYLESIVLLTGRDYSALQCLKGTFRAFSFKASAWLEIAHRRRAPGRKAGRPRLSADHV